MRDFAGRTCVVTGAGSGIGRALALALADRGAVLALSDVDRDGVEQTAQACRERGSRTRVYRVDVVDRPAVIAHADQVSADLGPAALVINNAGVSMVARIEETAYEDFRWVMDINFWGVVHGTQAFLPHLLSHAERGEPAHLVNLSSIFGLLAVPKQSAYCSSKFAVRGFTEAVRQDLAGEGHRVAVSCVHPGGVRTAIADHARMGTSEDKRAVVGVFRKVAMTRPEAAAASILRGVERDRARILVGYDAALLAAVPRLLGPRYQRVNAFFMRVLRY